MSYKKDFCFQWQVSIKNEAHLWWNFETSQQCKIPKYFWGAMQIALVESWQSNNN